MLHYRVFGGVFASPIPFPELRPSDGDAPPGWTLGVREQDAPLLDAARAVGSDQLAAGIAAEAWRTDDVLRLRFDDTGTFDITAAGTVITWYPQPGCDRELGRIDLLGRVLAAATHEQGLLCLHGSAVAVHGRAVGFLAAKGSGKSTLATALASIGGRLLTDDTLPIDPGTALASPGVHSIRLRQDAAARFDALGGSRIGYSQKHAFDTVPETLLQHDPVPVGALYELTPRDRAEVPDLVRRTRLPIVDATVLLMMHSKLGALLGGPESRRVFERCALLAAKVPVYRLEVARDLGAVEDVAATVAGWHA
jgi:hypothetical protein